MAFISKSTINEVNNRLDAISAVSDYLALEKKGGRWWGRCPFHAGGQEKTPSFKVDPESKLYHCFGCGKGGSVISFIMEMDKISYPEAVKLLAKKMGIEIIFEDGGAEEQPDTSQKDELFEIYRRTTLTFQHFLSEKQEGNNALGYILSRSITKEMIERFKLGYAPADRDFLHKFLMSKGYSQAFLEKTGLFSSKYTKSPLFSGRLMFPINDKQGKVVAFGGRALPGVLQSDGKEPPKYINSPETEIYKKAQTLYALDLALPQIRQTKTVYLAEGYLDVIALHQAGITNAVAPLGTAFTEEQAKLLHRWAEKIILVFDTDEAGEKAAYKAIITCRKNGLSCALVWAKEALEEETGDKTAKFKDPADILQKFGSGILNKLMNCTINDFEYLLFRSRSFVEPDGSGKSLAADFLFSYVDALDSEIERDGCIALIADSFGVERGSVQKDYSRRKQTGYSRGDIQDKVALSPNRQIRMNAELFLLTVVAVNMKLYPEFRSSLEIKEIDDPDAKEIFIAMEECFVHDENDIDSLLARVKDSALRDFIAGRGTSAEFKDNSEIAEQSKAHQLMEDGINEIRKKRLRKRLAEIGADMRKNERAMDIANGVYNVEELLAEKKYLDSQLRKLEGR